jgi:hypothetical protein
MASFEMISLITFADPFRIIPPVYWDNPHEIGYWSTNNLITNMKQSLAFVENSTAAQHFYVTESLTTQPLGQSTHP